MGLARFSMAMFCAAALAAVAFALPRESNAFELPAMPPFKWKVAQNPWRVNGDLGYSFERILEKNTKPVRNDRHTANLHVGKGAKGFVWQPWILRWDTNTNLGGGWFKDTKWDHNLGGDQDIRKSNVGLTRDMNTDYTLQFLPETRFPLVIKNRFVYKDTTEAKEGTGGDLSYDHSVEQQFASEDGGSRGSLKWQRTRTRMGDRKRPGLLERYMPYILPGVADYDTESLLDSWQADGSHRLKDGDLSFNARNEKRIGMTDTSRTTSRESTVYVRNNYSMGSDVFLDSQFNAGRSRIHDLKHPVNQEVWELIRSARKAYGHRNRPLFEELVRRAIRKQVSLMPDFDRTKAVQLVMEMVNAITRERFAFPKNEEQVNTHWYQWNNTSSWRPEGSQFSLTFTNRAYYTTNTSVKYEPVLNEMVDYVQNVDHGNKTNLISANTGISGEYAFTDHLRASINLTTDINKNKTISHALIGRRHLEATDWNRSSTPTLQISYNPGSRNLGPFQYNWNASSGWGIVFARELEPYQTATEQLGHSLHRSITLSRTSRIDLQLSESATLGLSSHTRAEKDINHGFTVRWTREHEDKRTMISLNANDGRFWGAEKGEQQMWNLQITRSGNLEGGTIWSGDLTLQWNREKFYGETSEISKTGIVSLSLQQPNLFDVMGLTATSTLSVNAPMNLYPMLFPYKVQTIDWNGQMDYRIGMMQLSLKAQFQAIHDQDEGEEHEGMVFVEVKRYLDMNF